MMIPSEDTSDVSLVSEDTDKDNENEDDEDDKIYLVIKVTL